MKKYLEDNNNEISRVYCNNKKFRDFISSFSEAIEKYRYKGFYFIAIVGTFSAISLSNLIQISYYQKEFFEALQITFRWIISGFIIGLLITIIRSMFIDLYEMKYSDYKQFLRILKELNIEKQ